MNTHFKGFSKIFSFTFNQHTKSKGYKLSTIGIALLCLILPAAIMIGIELMSEPAQPEPDMGAGYEQEYEEPGVEIGDLEDQEVVDMSVLKNIYLVDISDNKKADFEVLEQLLAMNYGEQVKVKDFGDDLKKANKASKGNDDTLLIITDQVGSEYTMNIVLPEGSEMDMAVANQFEILLMTVADFNTVGLGGEAYYFPGTSINGFYEPVLESETAGSEEIIDEEELSAEELEAQMEADEAQAKEELKRLVSMVMSYLNVMILYFFVLIYGQGVANSVIMEKSSKLMESFLVCVNPAAIIMGKLFAITLTGIIQLFSWLVSLGASFAIGMFAVKEINPDSTMAIFEIWDMLKSLTEGMFSPLNCIMALVIIMCGMLLYCALAGIGGAMASKAEDLSSANILFTMVLVVSFLAALFGGGLDGDYNAIFDWIPFISVMLTPSRIALGMIPLWKSLMCIGLSLAVTVVVTFIAGKVYKNLVFYRGDALSPFKRYPFT